MIGGILMVRSFIVLLMLTVVFLAGMVLGVDRGQSAINPDVDVEQEVEVPEPSENKQMIEKERIVQAEEASNEEIVDAEEEPMHLTQKTASLLETGVKGFYEMVVQMLYQISQLFF